jgi:uncharacterized protein YjiS (DUF1127 family)
METTIHITEVKMTNTLTLTQSIFVKAYNSIQNFMTKLSERKAKVRLVKKTVKQLNELTDRELRDIGLSRYDIELVAKEYMNELNSK